MPGCVAKRNKKIEKSLEKAAVMQKSRLKKLYAMVKRRKMISKKHAAGADYRSGSGDSTVDVDEIEGNPWFFAQTLFPAVSG